MEEFLENIAGDINRTSIQDEIDLLFNGKQAEANEGAENQDPVGLPAETPLDTLGNDGTSDSIGITTTLAPPENLMNATNVLDDGTSGGGLEDTTIWSGLVSIGWIFLSVYLCCCQRRSSRRETWRGAEIRRRFQEFQELERLRKAKEAQTPEQREELVSHNMRIKVSCVALAKC